MEQLRAGPPPARRFGGVRLAEQRHALLDGAAGPQRWTVRAPRPDTHDRYYVLQFVDAWTNNFAYIGRRATGTAEADYLLTPPGYTGDAPAGMTPVEVPSMVAVIVGRVQVDSEADLAAVHKLQDQFTLRPLAADQGSPIGIPAPNANVAPELAFWEQLRVSIAAFPPPDADAEFLAVLKALGVTGDSPLSAVDSQMAAALTEGEQQGRATIDNLAGARPTPRRGRRPSTCSTTTSIGSGSAP